MVESPLVSAAALAGRLDDPQLRLADVRWYVGEPGRNRAEYDAGHLPGAIYFDIDSHLTWLTGPGRHPLPASAAFAALMGSRGLGDDHLIVAYDDAGGAYPAGLIPEYLPVLGCNAGPRE
ncbi:MAG: rhodanese-like domain-containing protein [Actinomycetota bacterium]